MQKQIEKIQQDPEVILLARVYGLILSWGDPGQDPLQKDEKDKVDDSILIAVPGNASSAQKRELLQIGTVLQSDSR